LSSRPADWIGRWEPDGDGRKLWAADLAVDRLTGKTALRERSFSDRIAEQASKQRWLGLHHFGTDHPLVSAVAAAEMDLPLLFSFAPGEVEPALYERATVLRTALRAAGAFTAASREEAALVSRWLAPENLPGFVVPELVAEADEEPQELSPMLRAQLEAAGRPLLGCWGHHGRLSGLSILLEVARALQAGLVLVGSFEKSELYDLATSVDRHPLSERILRPGRLPRPQALAVLRACDLAVFPLRGPGQARYALEALAAGVKVLVSATGPLLEVDGLTTVAGSEDWEGAVTMAMESWSGPAPGWSQPFSSAAVEGRWRDVYRAMGWCS
jgi:nucleotide-binding universal stress UspA family protein